LPRQQEDVSLDTDMKIILSQIRRSEVYSQILSRAADLFEEHLNNEIEVTDYEFDESEPE